MERSLNMSIPIDRTRASNEQEDEMRIRYRVLIAAAFAGLLAASAVPAAAGGPQSAEVRSWPAPGEVVSGKATLVRQPHGASFTYRTRGFEPGHAHTIWFVAFNAPENCETGEVSQCGTGDLARPETEPTAMWGASNVVGASGKARFGGRLRVGDTSGCDELGRLPCNEGLKNPAGAEIHLVPRTHGPKIPGLVAKQIHSFNRGCEAGEPNVGLCANLQFAVFEPES
jgi:hypothetical protein